VITERSSSAANHTNAATEASSIIEASAIAEFARWNDISFDDIDPCAAQTIVCC
jgi:hypothetical protein